MDEELNTGARELGEWLATNRLLTELSETNPLVRVNGILCAALSRIHPRNEYCDLTGADDRDGELGAISEPRLLS